MAQRSYTVMIVPDARARFRRFQVTRRTLIIGASALALVGLLALSTPWLLWRAHSQGARAELLAQENAALQDRTDQFESSIAALRDELGEYERQTTRLAWMAGDMDAELPSQGAGSGEISYPTGEEAGGDRLRAELDVLRERSDALGEQMDRVATLFSTQGERLASIPSILPVQGLIGHGFGWRRDPFTGQRRFHQGLDISAPEGTPVRAPADGVVVKARRYGGYGNVIYLSHGNGLVTRYGHLKEFKAKPGQRIQRGDVVALVGNTGRSTAPHLHYEVLLHNRRVNPMKYVISGSSMP
jgi:murein DD-endopeptidase MepM/ murein hydrolase activator NlpD